MAVETDPLDAMAAALAELTASAAAHGNDAITPPGQRKCPICGKLMETIDQHQVSIDVCADHGVWLDQGEFAQLLERVYHYRRQMARKPAVDRKRHGEYTRQAFTAGLRRVANLTVG